MKISGLKKIPGRGACSLVWFFLFAVLFGCQVFPRLTVDSPAGDETHDIVDGYFYWKGDVLTTAEHPPLAKALQGLPLWAMGLRSKWDMSRPVFDNARNNDVF